MLVDAENCTFPFLIVKMLSPFENAVSTLKFYKKLEIVENGSDSKAHNF